MYISAAPGRVDAIKTLIVMDTLTTHQEEEDSRSIRVRSRAPERLAHDLFVREGLFIEQPRGHPCIRAGRVIIGHDLEPIMVGRVLLCDGDELSLVLEAGIHGIVEGLDDCVPLGLAFIEEGELAFEAVNRGREVRAAAVDAGAEDHVSSEAGVHHVGDVGGEAAEDLGGDSGVLLEGEENEADAEDFGARVRLDDILCYHAEC